MPLPQIHSEIFAASLPSLDKFIEQTTLSRALTRADLDIRALSDPPLFIPLVVQAKLADAIVRETDELIICSAIKDLPYQSYGVYAEYVLGAPNLGQAIMRAIKAFKFIYYGSEVVFYREDGRGHLRFKSNLDRVLGSHHLDEGMIWSMINLIRCFLGPEWRPERVELKKVPNAFLGKYEEIYGTTVRWTGGDISIVFDQKLLETPNPQIPLAHKQNTSRDLRKLVSTRPGDRMADLARHVIDLQLRLNAVSMDTVANRVGLGVRTLQRRLQTEGYTYQDCLDQVRIERATELLSETSLSIREIANALGFEEENSFRRLFRKQMGVTAVQYRQISQYKG